MNMADISKLGISNPYRQRYDNFIDGKFSAPVNGVYFKNSSPIFGKTFCEVARSCNADIELALNAAHAAAPLWAASSASQRAQLLSQIAERMESNLALLAMAETLDSGSPIYDTTAADIPLAIDHCRYTASCIAAHSQTPSALARHVLAYHIERLPGVTAHILPATFPMLAAICKLVPALAAGHTIVLKPAEQTPASIMVLMELIADLLPPGVVNIVNGFAHEAGKHLAASKRLSPVIVTGETGTGLLILQYIEQASPLNQRLSSAR